MKDMVSWSSEFLCPPIKSYQRRPHYGPHEHMAILELRATRGWSLKQTADTFLVTMAAQRALRTSARIGRQPLWRSHSP